MTTKKIQMKKIMLIALIAITTTGTFAQQDKTTCTGTGLPANNKTGNTVKHKVVIQLSSNDTLVWKSLMNNIKHLKEGWGETVMIEVVTHGFGIEMLVTAKTTEQKRITEFKNMGVVFVGCENTMRLRKITKEEMIPEAGFVPMGVGEVILKQEQGWSYLKAGF